MIDSSLEAVRAMIADTPVFDIHTHLGNQGSRQARTLAELVGYHWLRMEHVRAGAQVEPEDSSADPEAHMRAVLPFMPAVATTATHACFLHALRGLYGFDERMLTAQNWRALDAAVRAKAADPAWVATVLDKARVRKLLVASRDGCPQASGPFVPYDYAELAFSPVYLKRLRDVFRKRKLTLNSYEDIRQMFRRNVAGLRERGGRALHVWVHEDWHYTAEAPTEAEADALCQKVFADAPLSAGEQNALINYGARFVAEEAAAHNLTVQLFHGMQSYFDSYRQGMASHWDPAWLRALPAYAQAHPRTRFDVFLATRIPSHEAASLARTSNNLSVSGAWWHGFTPSTLIEFYRDRFELLPNTCWSAFFSDAYTVEWIYAKVWMAKECLARTLAALIADGLLVEADVPVIARRVLYENALAYYDLPPDPGI